MEHTFLLFYVYFIVFSRFSVDLECAKISIIYNEELATFKFIC